MIRKALLSVFALLLGADPLVAGEYTVEISGAAGTVGGTCLCVTASQTEKREVSGTIPLKLELSGDLISCAILRKAEPGDLHLVIRNSGGRIVAESSEAQPFGVVMAAGK